MDKIPNGPFKATRLWNMVATSFRQIPTGVHWKNMRKYDDCFTSAEAVDWMMEYLRRNPNFGEEKGTRNVAVRMLDRLLSHEAFEPVKAGGSQPRRFKEDGQLYRFSTNSRLVDKSILRPLSTLNMNHRGDNGLAQAMKATLSADDVWLDELRVHLAKLLRLETASDLEFMAGNSAGSTTPSSGGSSINVYHVDVSNVTSNAVNPQQGNQDNFPQFVLQAIGALECWPNPLASSGVPVSIGFERCLLFVVEGYLRGLSQPLLGTTTNDLLRKVFEQLSPSTDSRRSSNFDSSSSVESFMHEILNYGRRGSYPDVCLETAFAGTVPETRLIRKRPRSNSLFPTTDFMLVNNSSTSHRSRSNGGSAECMVPASLSDSGSTASIPLMLPAVPQTPVPLPDSGSGSLEKMNPGYRDDSYADLDDQFFTPQGKFPVSDVDWREMPVPTPVYSPELIRGLQLALLTESPVRRGQLERLLAMFEKMFKNNQLHFSDELSTQDFVTHCFTSLIFGEVDMTSLCLLTVMVLHRAAIFSPADDFKLKVELRMKSMGMTSTFCRKISKSEYEGQKSMQSDHMTELLNGIVTSSTMNIKEKRKKLKQFQKSYPDIYAARFHNSTSQESIFTACSEKPKPRLTKFKSLRM